MHSIEESTDSIFRVTRAIQKAVADLKAGCPMPSEESVTFREYEDILGLSALEDEFAGKHETLSVPAASAS